MLSYVNTLSRTNWSNYMTSIERTLAKLLIKATIKSCYIESLNGKLYIICKIIHKIFSPLSQFGTTFSSEPTRRTVAPFTNMVNFNPSMDK